MDKRKHNTENNKISKNKSKGITLIALVISIIVMLILAGVSLNATIGDNGVLTKAKEASIVSKKASILEELNYELTSYNINSMLNNQGETTAMLGNLINKGLIDTILSSSEEYIANADSPMGIPQFDDSNNYTGYIDYAVKKEDYSIIISIDDNGIYRAKYGDVNISSGGSVAGGTTLVTDKAFTNNEGATAEEQGKFVIDNNASVMFVDEISGELSIQVKSGTHAKVYAFKDMTLTNSGIKRSAIDIEPGGTLDLFVAEGVTMTVNSGVGSSADQNNNPGKGGYAGIHVPEGAILNFYGKGSIYAYGGDAGDGSLFLNSGDIGGSGGGGAGAGIGGNGGAGGTGLDGISENGKNGENCGNINIYNDTKVNAFGGNCGKGANAIGQNASSGSGYPAAGIGGGGAGGAGGSCCAGGGGFQGGVPQPSNIYYPYDNNTAILQPGNNGFSIKYVMNVKDDSRYRYWGICGGSYYSNGLTEHNTSRPMYSLSNDITNNDILSGLGGCGEYLSHLGGSGGIAGKGGTIRKSQNSKIFAYNGSRLNDGNESRTGNDETIIYAQLGIITQKYEWYENSNIVALKLKSEQSYIDMLDYVNEKMINKKVTINSNVPFLIDVDMSKQGIGSGAGYIEISNGTYTIDSSMN